VAWTTSQALVLRIRVEAAAAMQALGYVAPELLVPRLKVAEEDPHPHIRAAAHKALNRILPQG
ncbi:hypothetical protein, partial [Xanthomonas oryzae]|uniref:hypothetical protein n=1 Tax=Xanthomonas oryzae TaxID=347 RepID=UPI001C4D9084